jgi:hypothetical protein
MAEETVQEEVVDEGTPATEEVAGVSTGLEFLDEAAKAAEAESDEPGFVDVIGEELEKAASTETEEKPAETEEKPAETEEKPAETDERDLAEDFPKAEDLAERLDEKAQAKWGELRTELAEERKRAAELEAKLDDTQKQSVASKLEEELADARKVISEYEGELAVARVEQTPEYKRVVAEPLQAIMDAAEALATRNEVDVNRVFDVLAETQNIERQTKEIEALTENMSQRDTHMIYRMVDDAASLFAKDAQLKTHAAEAMVEIETQQAAQLQEAAKLQAIEVRSAVSKIYDKMESVLPTLEDDKGKEVPFETFKEKTLGDDYTKLGAEHQAYALSAGTVLPPLIRAVRQRDAKIAQLEERLAKFDKATPKAGAGGSGVKATKPSSPIGEEEGFFDAVSKQIPGG